MASLASPQRPEPRGFSLFAPAHAGICGRMRIGGASKKRPHSRGFLLAQIPRHVWFRLCRLRAILKASDVCASQPKGVARLLADKGLASYDNTLQLLREIPYGKWRQYDAEDSLRFFALRMRDVGFIRSSPQKIIAHGTDWRFFNELKKELKA